jgi:hypothetical protein
VNARTSFVSVVIVDLLKIPITAACGAAQKYREHRFRFVTLVTEKRHVDLIDGKLVWRGTVVAAVVDLDAQCRIN